MLASFVIFLRPHSLAPLGRSLGKSLMALLLKLVQEVNPPLAEELHSAASIKPFTVSVLRGRFVRQAGREYVTPDETYGVRYTVLRDDVFNALAHVLLGKQVYQEPVIIDGQSFGIEDMAVEPGRSRGWAELSSYEQVLEQARQEPRIGLEFASPTAFKQGDINLLFPLPVSVFGSLLRRWQAFSPQPILEEGLLDFVQEHVVEDRYELRTELISYGGYSFHGFTGECHYRILGDDANRMPILNALADFALFSGVGQKATQGMGQARRVSGRR